MVRDCPSSLPDSIFGVVGMDLRDGLEERRSELPEMARQFGAEDLSSVSYVYVHQLP